MHWLIRPAIGWGAWILLHSVAVPLVYSLGKKACGKKQETYAIPEQSQYPQPME